MKKQDSNDSYMAAFKSDQLPEEPVLLPGSFGDIYVPSDFAQESLYYCTRFGHTICDEEFHQTRIRREGYGFFYIVNGVMGFHTIDEQLIAKKNDVIFWSRKNPHGFRNYGPAEFLWLHFNGNSASNYDERLFDLNGTWIHAKHDNSMNLVKKNFENVIHLSSALTIDEHHISVELHSILAFLAAPKQVETGGRNHPLAAVLQYMEDSFNQNITIEQLAAIAHMSKYHFIRSFQEYMNCTPHRFLLMCRLNHAKQLLLSTNYTNEQISELCGFNSASHFARTFRNIISMSPQQYRKCVSDED